MDEQNKIGLGDIFNSIGIIALSVCIFFGLMFINNGSLTISAVEAVFIVLALFGITFLLMKLKSAKTEQADMKKWEIVILLLGYGTLAISTLFLFTHFVNMEFNLKEDIKRQGKDRLENLSEMFSNYETHVDEAANAYNLTLDNEAQEKRNTKKDSSIIKKVNALKKGLFLGYNGMKSQAATYVNKGHAIFDRWNLLKVPQTYYDIPKEAKKWQGKLIELSTSIDIGEGKPFEYELEETATIDLSNPKAFLGKTNWFLTLIPFIILHLMILWPYLFTASRSANSHIDGKSGEKTGFEM